MEAKRCDKYEATNTKRLYPSLSWRLGRGKKSAADPAFGEPRCVDILLGVDVFVDILRNGRRTGPSGLPVAVDTELG